MRVKLILLFLLTVLIPTVFLVYFSLQAVKGEKEILETNLREKYQSIASIVLAEIQNSLKKIPESLHTDPKTIEPLFFKNTLLFKDEVMIFDQAGRAVDGNRKRGDFSKPAYIIQVDKLPYELAVYEHHPVLLSQMATTTKKVTEHVVIVTLCATAILLGAFFTLGSLSRGWRKTQIKSEFISHLVHDLRGPLTSVRMFSEMLDSGRVPSDDKRKEYYRIISAESEKLLQLANNVLDFSHIENRGRARRYQLKSEDLAKVVQETVTRFQSHIANETHRISSDISSTSVHVKMDADAIAQVIMNLLSNAVKYSPVGSEIRVVLAREGKTAALSVIDQGIGIPKMERKKIFQEYYRGEDREVKNREGSGLGLALVKYAILRNRGKVIVKSEEGKGSEFRIELPIHEG